MTHEFLEFALGLHGREGAAQEVADGLKKWADENIINGYYTIEIDSKYLSGKYFFPEYKEKRKIKIPAKGILKIINERQTEADGLHKLFAELSEKQYWEDKNISRLIEEYKIKLNEL